MNARIDKWENGQSFPDIQNLIQLSDIFKVSIDRLVKANDYCNISIFGQQQFSKQDIRMFLVRAKNSTYITSNNIVLPSKPNSKDYRYTEGEYTYMDTYIGNENFNIDFLKESLTLVSCEIPYRGPEFYQKGDYAYYCQVNGDFDFFYGEEKIYCKQDKVYFCRFHGGNVY